MDSYIHQLVIKTSPQELHEAITTKKGLAGWWTRQVEIYPKVGGIATFHFGKNTFVVMKIAKVVLGKQVIWKCVDQYFKIRGTDTTNEWVGTMVRFEMAVIDEEKTSLIFTHTGLIPQLASYKQSQRGWDHFLRSLKKYLETGKGKPYKK